METIYQKHKEINKLILDELSELELSEIYVSASLASFLTDTSKFRQIELDQTSSPFPIGTIVDVENKIQYTIFLDPKKQFGDINIYNFENEIVIDLVDKNVLLSEII